MMNVMYTNGWNSAFIVLWGLHILSVLAFTVGILFLLFWAYKHLTTAQLKQWGWTLFIGGSILCLFTIALRGQPWSGPGFGGYKLNRMPMMQLDADDKDLPLGMMGSTGSPQMGKNGMGMSMMLRGRTGEDFDRAFIQLMIPHHQDAIEMAKLAQQNAAHAELKTLANDIITAQQREIDLMKSWQNAWGY